MSFTMQTSSDIFEIHKHLAVVLPLPDTFYSVEPSSFEELNYRYDQAELDNYSGASPPLGLLASGAHTKWSRRWGRGTAEGLTVL